MPRGGGGALDVVDHFEGERGEQTCGRKDLKHHMERDGEGGGVIQALQLAAGDEGKGSPQSHEEEEGILTDDCWCSVTDVRDDSCNLWGEKQK